LQERVSGYWTVAKWKRKEQGYCKAASARVLE